MKKTILAGLIVGITLMFGSWAMARPMPQLPTPPANFKCSPDADSVYFDWDDVPYAQKYSVDVEVLLEEGQEGGWQDATIIKLSFGTSDRTDGFPIYQSDLNVPAELFGFYVRDDITITWIDLSGYTARAHVKAIGKIGQKGRSQNNPFSSYCPDFILP